MADGHDGTANPPLGQMISVCTMASKLRGQLADCQWGEEEVKELRLSTDEIYSAIVELDIAPSKGKFPLEYKLARAAAEAILPHCKTLEIWCDNYGHQLGGSVRARRIATSLSEALRSALGVFIALGHGL